VLDEDAPDDILIDLDTECTGYLLGNLLAAEAGDTCASPGRGESTEA
jgi:hypothetical protein